MRLCLDEDELYRLTHGRTLGETPEAEAHLADCGACSSLLATLLDARPSPERWGALTNQLVGPYLLVGQVGAGAMGAVYRATDTRLGRTVAVKVLAPHARGRLEAEARAAAAIDHPNVVRVYDVGESWVVEELVEGRSLREAIARGKLELAETRRLAVQLARGLEAAHGAGVVHRDLKPENLLVTAEGVLKILDFGLARRLDADEPPGVHGTPGYFSPEQARGERVDARSDLFAAGAIVYELATGRRAFGGADHAQRIAAVLRETPPVDELGPLAPIVGRCLEKEPRRRFQSAADLAWALEQPAAAPAKRVSRRGFIGAAAAAGALGLVGGRWWGRRGGDPPPPEFRQLTHRQGRIMTARFTSDGGSLLYGAAWEGEPLAPHQLRLDGGLEGRLDLPGADVLAVSSRGELALGLDRRNVEGHCALGRLAVAPLAGGTPRVLLDQVADADFTPDGASLAVVRRDGRRARLELVPGNALLDVAGWISHPRVSPDGRRIACLVHPSAWDDRGDLVVVDRGGASRTLAAGYASASGVAWDPSGDRVWISASRADAGGAIWTVGLDGRERIVLQAAGRLRLHDVGADRRLAVSGDEWRLRTVVGVPGGGERDATLSQFSLAVDLSGSTLLSAEVSGGTDGAYLRPLGGGPVLRVGDGRPIALSPSGTLVAAEVAGAPLTIYSTRSAAGPALALGPIDGVGSGRFIDETRLVLTASAGPARRMWLATTGGAQPIPLTEEDRAGKCELDPARRRAAFVDDNGRLVRIDVDARRIVEVAGGLAGQRVCGWSPDGRSVLVRGNGTPLVVTAVDAETGARAPALELVPPPVGFKIVDALIVRGDAYAYSFGQELSRLFLVPRAENPAS